MTGTYLYFYFNSPLVDSTLVFVLLMCVDLSMCSKKDFFQTFFYSLYLKLIHEKN